MFQCLVLEKKKNGFDQDKFTTYLCLLLKYYIYARGGGGGGALTF